MKILPSILMCTMLVASTAYSDGFEFRTGPFSLEFGGVMGDGNSGMMQQEDRSNMIEHPICAAISSQKRLIMTVRGREITSPKELKIVTKQITVEPYALGTNKDGKPVFIGNVVEDKLIKEVTVKFSEDKFTKAEEEASDANMPKKKGFFAGMFSSNDGTRIDIRRVQELRVEDNSHFDVPKDFKGFKDDNVQVVCEVPVAPTK